MCGIEWAAGLFVGEGGSFRGHEALPHYNERWAVIICGIAGFYLKDPDFVKTDKDRGKMEQFLDHLLLGIQSRGTDATGFIAQSADGKEMQLDKRPVPAMEFIKERKRLPSKTQIVMGHARYETQGPASNWFNNHPVGYKNVYITHNGTIMNDDSLFREKKLTRFAEVDSEIIAALIQSESWDDLDKLNKELRGGYAVAAMDILKPGELLLFKGPSWPLAYHENEHFLVYASEARYIREAWGKTLGTPPDMVKFNHLSDREAVRVKGGVVSKVEAPKSIWKSSQTPNRWETSYEDDYDALQYGTCETPWHLERNSQRTSRPVTESVLASGTPASSFIRDNRVQIALMRADGMGKAITYSAMKADRLTETQKISITNKWELCKSCKETVAKDDFLNTLAWGRVCIDCHSFMSNPANATNEPEPAPTNVFNDLPMIDDLEAWVETESAIYYQCLLSISDDTGLQTATIDYLLNRITPRELRSNPPMRNLHENIQVMAEEAENKAWEEFAKEETTPKKCASFNNISAKCPGCDFCIIDPKEDIDDGCGVEPFQSKPERFQPAWISCASGTHSELDQCDACEAASRPDYSSKETKTTGSQYPAKSPTECIKCKKKAKISLLTSRGRLRWCYKHYNKCSTRGCQEKTVGCAPDGSRLCHEHFRGTTGGIQDKKPKVKNADPVTV